MTILKEFEVRGRRPLREPRPPPSLPPPRRDARRVVLGALALLLIVLVGAGEILGWHVLAGPLERALSGSLERRVSLVAADTSLQGRSDLSGPSLAAVGDPVGVTPPTSGPAVSSFARV